MRGIWRFCLRVGLLMFEWMLRVVDGWGGEGAVFIVHGFTYLLCKVLVYIIVVALCSEFTQKCISCVLFNILRKNTMSNY